MDDNTQPATPVAGDEQIRGSINYFTAQLRKAGLIGATAAEVGQDRELSFDPVSHLTDGPSPMIKSKPQPDR